MANFKVVPASLTFNKTRVRGAVSGLEAAGQVLSFTFTNSSGASIVISGVGYTDGLNLDDVTQPGGLGASSDFAVVPNATTFPVTVANNATQVFNVTFTPQRHSQGFDVRSRILSFVNNGGLSIKVPVGGPVIELGYDNPRVHPLYWGAGDPSAASTLGTGVVSGSKGMSVITTLADMDTLPHGQVMLFFAAPVTGNQAQTAFIPAVAATFTTGGASVPYAVATPAKYSSPRGGRSYQVLVFWTDDTVTMDITIRAITTGGNVVVATFPGVTYSNASNLFIGNATGLDLEGLSLTVQTANVTGATAYNIGAVITG